MRVIQQSPAWALHAYLRFLGISYTSENTYAFKALGLQLPLLVDQVHSKTETLALNYLSDEYGCVSSERSAEAVFSAYLKNSLVVPFSQLKRIGKTTEQELFRVLPTGLNFAVNIASDIRDFFCGDRYDALPGATEQELIESMHKVYGALNEVLLGKIARGDVLTFSQLSELDQHELPDYNYATPPPSPSRSTRSPDRKRPTGAGISEAVLFSHIAEVLCTHEKLAAVLMQHEGLLTFFQHIASTYFTVPYAEACANGTDRLNWKNAMNSILNNKFFTTPGSERVRQCLLHGIAIPCTRVEPEASADDMNDTIDINETSMMRMYSGSNAYDSDLYPSNEDVLDDSNPLALRSVSSPTTMANERRWKDPYNVRDEPTKLHKINFDLSWSSSWQQFYRGVMKTFGRSTRPANKQKSATSDTNTDTEDVCTSVSTVSINSSLVDPNSSTVTLGGAIVLMSVASCFAGYAYYTQYKKR